VSPKEKLTEQQLQERRARLRNEFRQKVAEAKEANARGDSLAAVQALIEAMELLAELD
jgi:hypothetical protein